MSTHKKIDFICIAIIILGLIITVLFMNGEALGIRKVVDEDTDVNEGIVYFTTNDLDHDWPASNWVNSVAATITLNGSSAKVSGSGAYVYDGDVVIAQGGYYLVSGSLDDGSIVVDAKNSSKIWILLDGVDIYASDDAALRVDQADKVFLTLAENTENSLESGDTYSEAALADGTGGTIFAHDDLTINGYGTLNVTSNYKHGIKAKDDLTITGGTVNITAVSDGINANDGIGITDAVLTIDCGDDGIDQDNEGGYLYIGSGTVSITTPDDAIHTEGDVTINSGEITIDAGDDGINSGADITINDGEILIKNCYEGLEAFNITLNGGNTTIYPSDDGLNATDGSGSEFGMGGFGGQMGGQGGGFGGQMGGQGGFGGQMEAPPNMQTTDGESTQSDVTQSESGQSSDAQSESSQSSDAQPESGQGGGFGGQMGGQGGFGGRMQAPPGMQAAEGESAVSSEDLPNVLINGGTLTIINNSGNDADGLDSNGNIYINGGSVRVSLVNNGSNSALDFGSESGGVCEITGGDIVACGSYSMAEGFDSSSSQCSILYNLSSGASEGTTVAIEDVEGNMLISYEVPCSFSSMVLSCPEMQLDNDYIVVIGDQEETITLTEISASFGDAASTMFGGTMNMGGMRQRGQGGFEGMSQNMSGDSNQNTSGTESQDESGEMSQGGPGGMSQGGFGRMDQGGPGGMDQGGPAQMNQDSSVQTESQDVSQTEDSGESRVEKEEAVSSTVEAGQAAARTETTNQAGESAAGSHQPSGGMPSDGMPSGEMPTGEMPSGEMPTGEMPTGEMPTGEMPSGEMPSGEMPSDGMPTGEMPSDGMPSGEMPTGEMPSGELPQGFSGDGGAAESAIQSSDKSDQSAEDTAYGTTGWWGALAISAVVLIAGLAFAIIFKDKIK